MDRDEICDVEYLDDHYGELLQYKYYDLLCTTLDSEMTIAAFPELGALMQDLKDHGESAGSSWCSTIAANKIGFKGHPGRAVVMALADDYEHELVQFSIQVPRVTRMRNEDSGYVWSAAVWKSTDGRDDVVIPGAPILEIDRKMRLALGGQKKGSFVKPQPYYLPVVIVAGDTFAFGGYWLDFHFQEQMAGVEEGCANANKEAGIKSTSSVTPSCFAVEVPGRQGTIIDRARLFRHIV